MRSLTFNEKVLLESERDFGLNGIRNCSRYSCNLNEVHRLYKPLGSRFVGFGPLGSCGTTSRTCKNLAWDTHVDCDNFYKRRGFCAPCLPTFRSACCNPKEVKDWEKYVGGYVHPQNIHCFLNKEECHPDTPCQSGCCNDEHGYPRDWRRYKENGGCDDDGCCRPCRSKEPYCLSACDLPCPPHLEKRFGARYMGWSHPSSFHYPRLKKYNTDKYPIKCTGKV